MVSAETVAWVFLVYLVAPLAILFLFWLVGVVRRRFFKAGGGEEPGSDAEL